MVTVSMVVIEGNLSVSGYKFGPYVGPGLEAVYVDINPLSSDIRDSVWVVTDVHYLPFRDSVVDGIYAIHVTEHLDRLMLSLREAYRVLKRDGEFTAVTSNFMSINVFADLDHKHVFNFYKLRRMLRRAGFIARQRLVWNIGPLVSKTIKLLIERLLVVSWAG